MKRASLISSYGQRLHLAFGSSLLSVVEIEESLTLAGRERDTGAETETTDRITYAHYVFALTADSCTCWGGVSCNRHLQLN